MIESKKKKRVLLLHLAPSDAKYSADGRCQTEEGAWLEVFPPIQLASIASAVRKKHILKLIDMNTSSLTLEEVIKEALEFDPSHIVLNTSSSVLSTNIYLVRHLRKKNLPTIIFYGEYATFMSKKLFSQYNDIDYIIRGEPETPICSLLDGHSDFTGIADASNDRGRWYEPTLDNLPIPAYELLGKYRFPLSGELWTFIRSGRGCPYKCIFCVMPRYNNKIRYHSVPYMIKQIKYCIKKLHIKKFMLWDEVATFDKKRMIEFCDAMIKYKLHEKVKWTCTTRVDLFDVELAQKMKSAGCFMIAFGIESINQKVLNANKKGFKAPKAHTAVLAAKKAGIIVVAHFIIGMLEDTRDTVLESLQFSLKSKIHFAQFYAMTPFVGSELYTLLTETKGKKIDGKKLNQKDFVFKHKNMSQQELKKLRRYCYFRFYFRPYVVISLLRVISLKRLFLLPLLVYRFFKWAK